MCFCWLEFIVLFVRRKKNEFILLYLFVIDNILYKKVEGSGEFIISLCIYIMGRWFGNLVGLGNEWLL